MKLVCASAVGFITLALALTPFEQIGIPPPLNVEPLQNGSQDIVTPLGARGLLFLRQSDCYYPYGWCSSQ